MSKSLISIVVGIVVLIGGYFIYQTMNNEVTGNEVNTSVSEANNETNAASTTAESASSKKMAFSQFLKNGGNYKCTVKQSFNGVDANGVVYISNSRVSATYDASVQGMQVKTNLIVKDEYTYSWSSVMPGAGIKVKVVKSDAQNTSTAMSAEYGFNADMIGDYNCEAWNIDETKFNLPSNINFKEIK